MEFKSVPGYRSPTAIDLQILPFQTIEHTAVYSEAGSLQVNIELPEAVAAGAQWRRMGAVEWRSSSAWDHGIDVGTYNIGFKEGDGWVKPRNMSVAIGFEEEKVLTVEYARIAGSLTVEIAPRWAALAGAAWRFQGETQWRPPSAGSLGTPSPSSATGRPLPEGEGMLLPLSPGERACFSPSPLGRGMG